MHNYLRKKHGSCPLTFVKRLERIAKIRAKKYFDIENVVINKDFKYGENYCIIEGMLFYTYF